MSKNPTNPKKRKLKIINKKLTVADFFCGCGGFSEGFNQAGFDVVFALDSWKLATETHDINHPNCNCVHMDILKITTENIDNIIPDVDVIIGSPPCVSFSNSNKSGKADKTLGKSLIHQFLKIVLYKKTKKNSKLKYWIMENVPNSAKFIKDSYTAKELGLDESLPNLDIKFRTEIVDDGKDNKEERLHTLKASDYGSPQGRIRAIVGDYILPEKTNVGKEVFVEDIFNMLGHPLNNTKEKIKDILFNFEIDKSDLTDHFYDGKIPIELWTKAKQSKVDHGFMGKMDFPDRKNRISRTIMATESYSTREAIIFDNESCDGYRAPTIREISSLMGFPINYQYKGSHSNKHKQIGNAVCVQMSYALAIAILKNEKIPIKPIKQRPILKLDCEQKNPLFLNFIEKPKKVNSKYCRHIPYLKLNQLRVELDNIKSNLKEDKNKKQETMEIKWSCSIHKGSGKNALQEEISNDILEQILDKSKIDSIVHELNKIIKPRVYNSKLFQLKNCRIIEPQNNHLSPENTLEIIKEILDNHFDDEVSIKTTLFFNKELEIKEKILYGLLCVNYIVSLLQ